MLNGLYKVEYGVNDAFGRSIMCMHNGKLLGGNSAFAHLGTYQESGEEIIGEVITQRHNDDPHYKPLMDTDVAAISVRGKLRGNKIRFEGSAAPRPGALFWADRGVGYVVSGTGDRERLTQVARLVYDQTEKKGG